jgi:hypothetical protein
VVLEVVLGVLLSLDSFCATVIRTTGVYIVDERRDLYGVGFDFTRVA